MAVTKIWRVKGSLGDVLKYVENLEKTGNPKSGEMTGSQGLEDVIAYAASALKTTEAESEKTAPLRRFVTGVNCYADTAREEMMQVKRRFNKTSGVICYHGYQSFAPGECTPEQAHRIGVELAKRLWRDEFQVLVTTHLDKAHHLHSHFVVNNVSQLDGHSYYRSARDYKQMQIESDALCRENNLTVVPNPQYGRTKHYAEHQAEKEGRFTWKSLIKADVDAAIAQSVTESQFFKALRSMGYEIKNLKYLTVKPPGKPKFLRLEKHFGEDYSLKGIDCRILANRYPVSPSPVPKPTVRRIRVIGIIHSAAGSSTLNRYLRPQKKLTGFMALYFRYLYILGKHPKRRRHTVKPHHISFRFREDLLKLDKYSREIKLLCRHRIDTSEQLFLYREGLTVDMAALMEQRKHLRYRARSIKDETKLAEAKAEITGLSKRISVMRKEVVLCDDIAIHTQEMKNKLAQQRQEKNLQNDMLARGRPVNRQQRRR